MNIADALVDTPVSALDLTRYVTVSPDDDVASTVDAMNSAGVSCACATSGAELEGIFTQRDVLTRVIGRESTWQRPIRDEMTRSVRTMGDDESVAAGLAIMNDWWVRSVPVLDKGGHLAGVLSFYMIMKTIAALVAEHTGDHALTPEVQHGLGFVDFTGLPISPPVSVKPEETVGTAAHHMRVRGIGSVLVTDEREHLVGVLTEFDLQYKVGCSTGDLESIAVEEVMTPDPVALDARSPIANAVQEMAQRGFSHIPLLGESGRPVGAASFRDIAAYLESSLAALG